ncbi:MAG: PHP domain-containing protein [Methanosarcinaceae archaeon]|nr:PHP domain-containing protein [Methanosarcinaceae archaeon]
MVCAKKNKGIVIIPHPFRTSGKGIGYIEGLPVDAAETLNSKGLTNRSNKKAIKEANRLNLPHVGGSDAHVAELIGQCYTMIDAPANTKKDILNAIVKGKTKAYGKLSPPLKTATAYKRVLLKRIKKNKQAKINAEQGIKIQS